MERRRFNTRERVAAYLIADGKCEDCGVELQPGWHGHHWIPHSLGGPTNATNMRALCPDCNWRRGNKMPLENEQWDYLNWFDGALPNSRLRPTQARCGPELIKRYRDLFTRAEKRELLKKWCSLYALTTGAGKTLLTVSSLLAINLETIKRIGKAERVKRVLWLVHERAAADQLEKELKKEVTEYGLHSVPPKVVKCKKSDHLQTGHKVADITICC